MVSLAACALVAGVLTTRPPLAAQATADPQQAEEAAFSKFNRMRAQRAIAGIPNALDPYAAK